MCLLPVLERLTHYSPTSMSKKICADISPASLVYKAREISNQIYYMPLPGINLRKGS